MRFLLLCFLSLGLCTLFSPVLHAERGRPTSISAASSPTTQPPAVFSLLTDRIPMVNLTGLWRFHPGDDPGYALTAFDDSAWPLLKSTHPWDTQGYKGLSGFAWYRFRVILPSGDESYSLILPPISTSWQCFVDGQLRASAGSFPPSTYIIPSAFNTLVLLHRTHRPQAETITVALRVYHTPLVAQYRGGGPVDTSPTLARVGETEELRQFLANYASNLRQQNTDLLFIAGLDLLAALASFILFTLRPSEREYLWFGVAIFLQSLRSDIAYYEVARTFDSTLRDFLVTSLDVTILMAYVAFYRRLLGGRPSILLRLFVALLPLEIVALALSYAGLSTFPVDNLCQSLFPVPLEIWVLLLLVRRAREGFVDARLLLFPVTLSFATNALFRLTTSFRQFNHPLPFDPRTPFLHTPFQFGLGDVAATIYLLAILAILMNRFARTSSEVDRTASELEAARSLQQVLFPRELPVIPGIVLTAAYHPAQEVGGDFFYVSARLSGETIVVLGDVSGKGLKAAMTVSLIVGSLSALVERTTSPAEILAGLNQCLHGRGFGFTTCLALRLSSAGFLTLANAGQLSPYHNGREMPTASALPLGMDLEQQYVEEALQLLPGDRLTLLTDGVPEASCHRELFGFARTEEISRELPAVIADAARSFGQTDDITALSIDFLPV